MKKVLLILGGIFLILVLAAVSGIAWMMYVGGGLESALALDGQISRQVGS